MLGQEGSDLLFRMRNGIVEENGLRHVLRARRAVQDSFQHFVAVYDHGVSSIFRNGESLAPVTDLRQPFTHLGLGSYAAGAAAGGMLMVSLVGLPSYGIFSFVQGCGLRHLSTLLFTGVVCTAPSAISALLVGGPLRVDLWIWLALTLAVMYPLGFAYVYRSVIEPGSHGEVPCSIAR
jgi:hypothetical protein